MIHPFKLAFEGLLAREGGLYTFDDVMNAIRRGDMQSFSAGDNWAITEIGNFPQKKVLHIKYVVGRFDDDYKLLENKVEEFAKSIDADMITAIGRLGWLKRKSPGWGEYALAMRKEIK